MVSKELIEELRKEEIFKEDSVKLKNAGDSNFYVDIKKSFGVPKILDLIVEELWKLIGKESTCVAAGGYGGIVIASLISSKYGLKLVLVRDEKKKYGTECQI